MTFYTYVHRRETDDAIFYVGKGQKKRAWSHHNRNKHWNNVVAKHGLKVEICTHWENDSDACDHEKRLIAQYRAQGLAMVNQTDGGEGTAGRIPSQAHRHKARVTHLKIVAEYLHKIPTKGIVCSNGLSFDSIAGARRWLHTIGHTKAVSSGLCHAAQGIRKSAYGFTWQYAKTNNSFKEAQ